MAFGTLGSLIVNVLLNTQKFDRNVGKSRGLLGEFEKNVESVKRSIVALGATLGAALSVNAFRGVAEEIDRIAKASDKLGISFGKFQGISLAAKLGGTDERTLEGALLRMNKALADGSAGFKQIGLDIRDLRTKKPEEVFLKIADAIKKTNNQATRISAASKIFGKGGLSLLPMLMTGALGISSEMGNLAPLTRQQAKLVEEMNDSITKLTDVFNRTHQLFVVQLAPAITKLAKWLEGRAGAGYPSSSAMDKIAGMSDKDFSEFVKIWRSGNNTPERNANRSFANIKFGLGLDPNRLGETTLGTVAAPPKGVHESEELINWLTGGNPTLSSVDAAIAEREGKQQDARRNTMQAPSRGILGAISMFGGALTRGANALAPFTDKIKQAERSMLWEALKSSMGFGAWQPRAAPQPTAQGRADFEAMQRRMWFTEGRPDIRGNAALEKGTVAAFSQERRSQQQNQLVMWAQKQHTEAVKANAKLNQIELNLRNNIPAENANLA